MDFNYLYAPCYADSSAMRRLEEASEKLRKAYAASFNAWLNDCVAKFCPEAWFRLNDHKDQLGATRALNLGHYHYRTMPDGSAEFCQDDTVLARAKFEIKFTVNKE